MAIINKKPRYRPIMYSNSIKKLIKSKQLAQKRKRERLEIQGKKTQEISKIDEQIKHTRKRLNRSKKKEKLKESKLQEAKDNQQFKRTSNHYYVSCSMDKRLQVLYSFLQRNQRKKILVILNSCEGVEFLKEFFQNFQLTVQCVHEKDEAEDRDDVINMFEKQKSGILLCSEDILPDLDLAMDWTVQYDPPKDIQQIITLMSKFKSKTRNDKHLLFITDDEYEIIRLLKEGRITATLLDCSSRLFNIQLKLEELIKKKHAIYLKAKQAYSAYVKSYRDHSRRDLYDIKKVDVKAAGRLFGFRVPPYIDLHPPAVKEQKKRKIQTHENRPRQNKKRKSK